MLSLAYSAKVPFLPLLWPSICSQVQSSSSLLADAAAQGEQELACEQALSFGEPGEVMREKQAKGDASALPRAFSLGSFRSKRESLPAGYINESPADSRFFASGRVIGKSLGAVLLVAFPIKSVLSNRHAFSWKQIPFCCQQWKWESSTAQGLTTPRWSQWNFQTIRILHSMGKTWLTRLLYQ